MAGRRPKPAALRLVQGNPGRRSLEGCEVIAPILPPDVPPPVHVTGRALEEWNRLTPILRDSQLLSTLDSNALAALCIAVAQLQDAQDALAAGGSTYRTDTGFERPSPHLAIAHRCITLIARLSVEFGLTPSARTRVRVDVKQEEDDFDRYMREGRELRSPRRPD